MGQEIKLRQKTKDIRLLDRVETIAGHLKEETIKGKEQAETQETKESSPDGYATGQIEGSMQRTMTSGVHKMAGVADRVVRKANGGAHSEKTGQTGGNEGGYTDSSGRTFTAGTKAGEQETRVQTLDHKRGVKKAVLQDIKMKDAVPQTIKAKEQMIKNMGRINGVHNQGRRRTIRTAEGRVKEKFLKNGTFGTFPGAPYGAGKGREKAAAVRNVGKKTVHGIKETAKVISTTAKAAVTSAKTMITLLAGGGWAILLIVFFVVLFGGLLYSLGGNSASATKPLSAEVEAYTPLIRQYAAKYGIPEYLDLIKAVMMQESAGRGLDPMQSSEGPFNTMYPKTPNGITSPEYSIACGVQELKSCLMEAKVESPIDMMHIKLGLQGYNFGNGYISWAVKKDGGYSTANAIEFSDIMAAKMGWKRYGDKEYVPHVLQYYPFGQPSTGMGSTKIVEIAATQIGNQGGAIYWSWYGFNSYQPWCACFVSWCAEQCGYIEAGIIEKFSYCPTGINLFKAKGQWKEADYTPRPGDIIFFDWEGDSISDHVGIVEKVEGGMIYTIEGNTSNSCARRNYHVGARQIIGYGTPAY